MKIKHTPKHVVVIGAGIVGISSAIWLKRYGYEVTLLDKGAAGMGASFGNACVLAACTSIPVTTPDLKFKIPKYVLDPNSPLFIRWPYLPKLLPFLQKYLSHANDKDTRYISDKMNYVIGDSVAQHYALAGNTQAGAWIKDSPYAFAYQNRAAFEAEKYVWDIRAQNGFVPEILEGQAVQDYQPALSRNFNMLAVVHDLGFILNPNEYITALVQVFQDMGGVWQQASVVDFDLSSGSLQGVDTDQGRIACDHAMIATGAYSKKLMSKLDLNIPLESERGYHVLYKDPSEAPTIPIMISAGKFVATPMNKGLRCAGVVEFGGLEAAPSKAPLELIRRKVKEAFPTMTASSEEEWMGHRPTTPDSLPLIGEVRNTGVFTAFGHQHLGLTAGPKTGRMVADMIAQHELKFAPDTFSPTRFND